MQVLLDTHTLIWALDSPEDLSRNAALMMKDANHQLLVSIATIWEAGIKVNLGKLKLSLPFERWIEKAKEELGVEILPISIEAATYQASMPMHHRDPFDRILISQAILEDAPFLSADSVVDQYAPIRLW